MTTEDERELYAELVLQCAESVPRGRVTTYGAIADVVTRPRGTDSAHCSTSSA